MAGHVNANLKLSLDRRLSGLELTGDRQTDILRKIAREEREKQVKMRHKLKLTLVAALVGALLVGGLAFAASRSGILARLFGEGVPNPEAEQLLTREDGSVLRSGVRLTLVESLYDRYALALTYEIENTTGGPVLLDEDGMEQTQVIIGGERAQLEEMFYNLQLLGGDVPGIDAPAQKQITMVFRVPEGKSGGPAQVQMTARLYKPLVEIKLDDKIKPNATGDENWLYEGADTLWLDAKGRTNPGDYEALWTAAQEITKDWTDDQLWNQYVSVGEKLVYTKMAEPLAALSLDSTIAPNTDKQSSGTRVAGQSEFELPEYKLVVEAMNFTSTGGEVALRLYPKAPVEDGEIEMHRMYLHPLSRWYALLDEGGEDILQTWLGAGSMGYLEDEGCFRVHLKLQPGGEIPGRVTIVPINQYESYAQTQEEDYRLQREHYAMDEAVTVELE